MGEKWNGFKSGTRKKWNWTSVEDGLPEESMQVIIAVKDGTVFCDYYSARHKMFGVLDSDDVTPENAPPYIPKDVVWWMPAKEWPGWYD